MCVCVTDIRIGSWNRPATVVPKSSPRGVRILAWPNHLEKDYVPGRPVAENYGLLSISSGLTLGYGGLLFWATRLSR